jgi:hypothetical protein
MVAPEQLDQWVEDEDFVDPEHKVTEEEHRSCLLDRIAEAEGNTGLPQFSGEWEWTSEIQGWKVYIVHDPCHDDDEGFVDDRNTVIAMSSTKGLWRIIGRELPRELSLKIAKGQH